MGVSYLATSRPDIQAGQFIADTYSIFGCDGNKDGKGYKGLMKH